MSVDPRIGTEIAGTRIEARLRPGGMSEVYQAEHLHLGRKVALKLLDPKLAQDEDYRKRFLRESRLAAALYHPNIVPIYDAGEADEVPYLMMHFVQGTDLSEVLRVEGALEQERALAIVGQVVKALDAAHDRGLVHRDVKPANILIASGEGVEPAGHVYLTDFGLAKQVASGTALTRKGLFMGTLDYVAPEQIQGQEVDRRADVYALACVAYQSLTGAVPFPRDSEVAMMYAHMNDEPPAATSVKPDLPPAVDPVLQRGMAKRPDDRYASAGELFADLREALEGPVGQPPVVASTPAAGVPAAATETTAPEAAPVSPPLVDVLAIDYQGARFALGRTPSGYAIWDSATGGGPIRTYPPTPEAWPTAWAAYQELEAAPAEEAVAAQAPAAEPAAATDPSSSGPQEALLADVVFLDYRGQKYALGRSADSYAIWDLAAGGFPVQTFVLQDAGWQQAWARYQELEASAGAEDTSAGTPPEAEAAPLASQPGELTGSLSVDYQGSAYALGRTSDAYAIWDVAAGGYPVKVFAQNDGGWQEAWAAYQELEATTAT